MMKASTGTKGHRILVIGGMNMDILGRAKHDFLPGDSLPGFVTRRPGGVARNIAACLASLGASVELMCPLGSDAFGEALRDACRRVGIGLQYALDVERPTSVYLAIHNREGDMVCAINDMRAMEAMTPEILEKKLEPLRGLDAAVLDANLSGDSLIAAAKSLAVPLIADPVSAAKSRRLLPILSHLYAIKPNRLEAKELTGEDDFRKAAKVLNEQGVQQVFISLGCEGLYYADKESSGLLPARPVPQVSLTGAGDAMAAGLAFGIARGLSIEDTAREGLHAATRFLENSSKEQ